MKNLKTVLKLKPSWESRPVISMEEEMLLAGELTHHANEADALQVDADDLLVRATALDNIGTVAGQIQQATLPDLALVEVATQLAAAGTGLNAEADIAPAMESYLGAAISTEGFKETAAKFIDAAIEMGKKVYEHVKEFFVRMFQTLPSVIKRNEELISKMHGLSGDPKADKITLHAEVSKLCYDGKLLPVSAVSDKVDELAEFTKRLFDVYLQSVGGNIAQMAAGLKKEIQNPDSNEANALDAVMTGLTRINVKFFETDPVAKHMLGDKGIVINDGIVQWLLDPTRDAQSISEMVSKFGVRFTDERGDAVDGTGSETIPLPATNDVEDALVSTSELLKNLAMIEDNRIRQQMQTYYDTLVRTIQEEKANVLKKDAAFVEKMVTRMEYRAASNLLPLFSRLINQPLVPFTSHALAVSRAVQSVAQKTIAAYSGAVEGDAETQHTTGNEVAVV